jgi:hypothetical protein
MIEHNVGVTISGTFAIKSLEGREQA